MLTETELAAIRGKHSVLDRGSFALSRLEIEALRTGQSLQTGNKREQAEWEEKKRRVQE